MLDFSGKKQTKIFLEVLESAEKREAYLAQLGRKIRLTTIGTLIFSVLMVVTFVTAKGWRHMPVEAVFYLTLGVFWAVIGMCLQSQLLLLRTYMLLLTKINKNDVIS